MTIKNTGLSLLTDLFKMTFEYLKNHSQKQIFSVIYKLLSFGMSTFMLLDFIWTMLVSSLLLYWNLDIWACCSYQMNLLDISGHLFDVYPNPELWWSIIHMIITSHILTMLNWVRHHSSCVHSKLVDFLEFFFYQFQQTSVGFTDWVKIDHNCLI